MTLKEKFKKIDIKLSETHSTLITNREADIMETIADEFAIGFALFLSENMYENMYQDVDKDGKTWVSCLDEESQDYETAKRFNIQEILQIFKK